ncbi:MAG: GNAT family N-acetyltransferase [Phycisphaeraceae bacterium]|nr:GNAT family N-acetyltransferase [Phycisphaeraceae bacterium]
MSEEQRQPLPKYPVPVALLGRLAVDTGLRGRGLGSHLLLDALCRVDRAGRPLGIHAVEVVAIEDASKQFYLKYGFTEWRDDPHHLSISMKTIRTLVLA